MQVSGLANTINAVKVLCVRQGLDGPHENKVTSIGLTLFAVIALAATSTATAQTAPAPGWVESSTLPSSPSLVWGSRITREEGYCCDQRSSTYDHEARLIETLDGRATRNGPLLSLRLASGTLRIIDFGPGCSWETCRFHVLAAYWPKLGYYVIGVGLYEGQQAYLISELEGRTTLVVAPPLLSPSGRYAIAWDDSPAYGNGVQLIDINNYPPLIFGVPPPSCPSATKQSGHIRPGPVWRDDSRIEFEGVPFFPEDRDAKQILRIVDGKPEWEC